MKSNPSPIFGVALFRKFRLRIVVSTIIAAGLALYVTAVLWSNPKGLTDAGQYALVQPMVETLIGTAFDVSVFVVTSVLAFAAALLTVEFSRGPPSSANRQRLRSELLGLALPAGASLLTITASFLIRVWVGYASFDWAAPYLQVAIPMIGILIFSMLVQLILLVFGFADVGRALLSDLDAPAPPGADGAGESVR